MTIKRKSQDNSKKIPVKEERKSDIYISYNALSQGGEVKSVSEAMHKYIEEGFAKITAKMKNS